MHILLHNGAVMRNGEPVVQILGILTRSEHFTQPLITDAYIKGHLIIHHEGIWGSSGKVLLFL